MSDDEPHAGDRPPPGGQPPGGEAEPPTAESPTGWGKFGAALLFLLPALFVLGALLVYPTIFTVIRSLYGAGGQVEFVGLDNYQQMLTNPQTLVALKNNLVWVLVAPVLTTALGLVFAVLIDRVSLQTAFKTVLFMPMAISFLAVGVIFRLVYQSDPDLGLANALYTTMQSVSGQVGEYPTARPSSPDRLSETEQGGYASTTSFSPGESATLGLVGIRPEQLPDAEERVDAARPPEAASDQLAGTVWFDFSPDGERGAIDGGEPGLPRVTVQAVTNGEVVAEGVTGPDGTFSLSGLDPGDYTLNLAASTFAAPPSPVNWLGSQQVLFVSMATWTIISAFIWMWAGFAMIIISAGLASLDRSLLEAARVDGASEWQVFRRITIPLLWPVILVVLVTLMINVLKIFDLVLVMAPGAVQDDATVVALEMWRVSFGGANDFGLGSALAVFLFVLVVPAMLFNLRRFRVGGST